MSSQKTKPNFYSFSQSHQWRRHSIIFIHPKCLHCFPTQENLATKTLNPKVPSFVVPSFSLFRLSLFSFKNELKHLNNTHTPSKLCHVCQIVTQLVRTTQDMIKLILKTYPTSWRPRHDFPKSCHDWAP